MAHTREDCQYVDWLSCPQCKRQRAELERKVIKAAEALVKYGLLCHKDGCTCVEAVLLRDVRALQEARDE